MGGEMRKRFEAALWFTLEEGPAVFTIGFAAYVIAMTQTTTPQEDVLLRWILAILGLLAISQLVERLRTIRHIEEVSDRTLSVVESRLGGRVGAEAFFTKRLPSMEAHLTRASDVRLYGVTLQRTVRDNIHSLAQLLMDGAQVKVALVDPNGTAAQRIANPAGGFPLDSLKAHTGLTIHNLRWLAALPEAKGTIELRYVDEEPNFNIIAMDAEKESGIIFVELYPQRWVIGARPRFELTPQRDGFWFGYFKQQFDRLWEDAKLVPLGTTPQGE
jgi:hypothetical protein